MIRFAFTFVLALTALADEPALAHGGLCVGERDADDAPRGAAKGQASHRKGQSSQRSSKGKGASSFSQSQTQPRMLNLTRQMLLDCLESMFPTATVMPPLVVCLPLPEAIFTAPPVAPVPAPPDTVNNPPSPPVVLDPAPALTVTAPPTLLSAELAPPVTDTAPPSSAVLEPAVTDTAPPAAVLPEPTVKLMAPPAPPVAAPLEMLTEPEAPLDDVPELNTKAPLTPDVPALAATDVARLLTLVPARSCGTKVEPRLCPAGGEHAGSEGERVVAITRRRRKTAHGVCCGERRAGGRVGED